MEPALYEQHYHGDPEFPFIFHFDRLDEQCHRFPTHYHESLELLYFLNGSATVILGGNEWHPNAGHCVAINQNILHSIQSNTPVCLYACLIISKGFCKQNGVDFDSVHLEPFTRDEKVTRLFHFIIEEMEKKEPFYKLRVKGLALSLLGNLCRSRQGKAVDSACFPGGPKDILARSAVDYIRSHLTEPLTLQGIADELHVSKFYFCRVFKEVTGESVIAHLNAIRCSYARQLIRLGTCNVSQAAYRSGYHNLSYFTRTYKAHFGICPGEEYPYLNQREKQ